MSESLTDPQKHKSDTNEILTLLEQRGLIELVFEDQNTEDKFYRFDNPFLRETLFKLQLYSTQRQVTHGRMITYLQENLLYNWQTDVIFLFNLIFNSGIMKKKFLFFSNTCYFIRVVSKREIFPSILESNLLLKKWIVHSPKNLSRF